MAVVVAGVSGSGKSTIGRAVADRLDAPFIDADDLHPAANVAKMTRGEPLDDADRAPWLDAVGAWLAEHPDGVTACSALRRTYRDRLRHAAPDVVVLLLTAERDVLAERVEHREGHFMPGSLLTSQLSTLEPLEPDEPGEVLDAAEPVTVLVDRALRALDVGGRA